MELTWWVVAIAGCIGLAACIGAVLLRPIDIERRQLRLLANVGRLTQLPEYRRAAWKRTVSAVVAILLLTVAFGAAVIAAARPTGLPAAEKQSGRTQPEDIMVCVGGPSTDAAVRATMRYFASEVKTFTSQRIGLTFPDRRAIPLTRDYQYAAAQFGRYSAASEPLTPVAYVDYAGSAEDALAMCLTGFPSFDQRTTQRRSVIYVGPASRRVPGETRPALFSSDAVRDLVRTADVQVNTLFTGSPGGVLNALAGETDGRSFPGGADVASHLAEIRRHPPPPAVDAAAAVKANETPDLPLILALAALAGLVLWPLVVRP